MRIVPAANSQLDRPRLVAVLLMPVVSWLSLRANADDTADTGEQIYRERCASCHGESGEGVKGKGKHRRPLAGDKSVADLARYIGESMPDDDPETCTGEDAAKVARYIHDAFYSPIARARIDLSRLTVRQYRSAAADLVGSFRAPALPTLPTLPTGRHGLRAEYFNSRQPERGRVLERIDPEVRFDFGRVSPAPGKLDAEGFTVRWSGSVLAPETGRYEFVVRTDHAARLWLNDPDRPLIDVWVKSGDDTDHRASIFLVGGRAYPLKLEFTSRTQGVRKKSQGKAKRVAAFIELHWGLPHRLADVIPTQHLSPEQTPEVFVVDTPFPPDDRSDGYERGTSVSKAWDDATTAAAIAAARYVGDHLEELAGTRGTRGGGELDRKLRDFCRRLVERAFRRPLTDDERPLYIDRQFATAPDLETAVKRVVLLALKSPRFLYLPAGGDGADAYDVASRLSFALWDSLPDRQLLEAAAAGRLSSRDELGRQAERMVQDPRTRTKVRRFLHYWLGIEHAVELAKDGDRFPEFSEALASDLRTSLDLFLEEVIWSESSDFRRLLVSRDLYVNGRLAGTYGFDLPLDAPFQKVSALRPQRVGVLSHPYLMASLAYRDSSSPIHRGVFLARGLLGRALRPPPEAFAPLAPDLHPDLTTRERIALQTRPKSCQGCHGMINSLGFALEQFDAIGRYREEEKGKPIDASGAYQLLSGDTRTFDGARELAEFLADSKQVHLAFVTQLFHHLVAQPIVAYGTRVPAELRRAFSRNDFNVQKLVAEIATTAALGGPGRAGSTLDPGDPAGYNDRRQRRIRL